MGLKKIIDKDKPEPVVQSKGLLSKNDWRKKETTIQL
jgi:hypothetical protein